jgi:hypothetical protein
MKPKNILAFSIALALAAPLLAQSTGTADARRAPKVGSSQPVFMPAADLKWTDLDPTGVPGVKVADLWGNHAQGRSARSRSFRLDSSRRFTPTPTR